jgi:hypothetical protein
MNYKTPFLVWLYIIVTTIGEVLLFYAAKPDTFSVTMGIGIIAMINAVVAALFLMNIRKEPPVIQYMILAPLALVMVLILTLLFALAQ